MNNEYASNENTLHHLYDEIQQLIQYVRTQSLERMHLHVQPDNARPPNKSIVNLMQYLALRELDLRPLQEKLAEAGLSSLGRAEPHVYANLSNIHNILSRALGKSKKIDISHGLPCPEFKEGFDILEQNTNNILGNTSQNRTARVIVTLPAEAATNYEQIYHLIKEGINIARINCAHDDVLIWQQMIANIRWASTELNTP